MSGRPYDPSPEWEFDNDLDGEPPDNPCPHCGGTGWVSGPVSDAGRRVSVECGECGGTGCEYGEA